MHSRRGQVSVLGAAGIIALLALCALVADVGLGYMRKAQLQSASDAAALAGAACLPDVDLAEAQAESFAMDNAALMGLNMEEVSFTFTHPYKGDTNLISVQLTTCEPFLFAPVLGVAGSNIGAGAAAESLTSGVPFDRALAVFSSEATPEVAGSTNVVVGGAHSNSGWHFSGSDNTVTGTLSANGSVQNEGGGNSFGQVENSAGILPMPPVDTDELRATASGGTHHPGDLVYSDSSQTISGDRYVHGKLEISGSDLSFNGVVYVAGDLIISGEIGGSATFVVAGQIFISGSNAEWTSADPASNLAFVITYDTEPGDDFALEISGSNNTFRGVFFAPNGDLKWGGASNTIYGSVYAESMSLKLSGSSNRIEWSEIDAFQSRAIRLIE
ncbi:MAG: pilus assembly protein TadG-related protein [Candidatus Brocadiia bacterium]|nr:pilus assembly protein TadG-related protein [Candidatus Brocadiia bacterium]